ncbi:hypothetical protein [Streptomyces sp. NPDC087300]|uniref:hypothetical protein n=1 Tax=Streptomyces sp. NPDC087300 TaxID=3365780 RepID=UPI0037FD0D88
MAALAFGRVEGRTYGWVTSIRPFDGLGLSWDGGLSPAFVALAVAALLLAWFVRRQVRLNRAGSDVEPLMNTRLYSISSFRNGNIATLVIGLGEFGIIAVLPLWLQFTLGCSALQAGAALLPLAVGSFFASGMSFGLAQKVSVVVLVRTGLALEAVALAALGVVAATTSAPWWAIILTMFAYGIGVGFATAQVTNVVLAALHPHRRAHARRASRPLRRGDHRQRGGRHRTARREPATESVAHAFREAMASGVALSACLAAGLLALGVLATLLIPSERPAIPREAEPETGQLTR